jgi:hypothetical protein
MPPILQGYSEDQADLLVRYMFEITPEEQRRLVGMSAGVLKPRTEVRGKSTPVAAAGAGVPGRGRPGVTHPAAEEPRGAGRLASLSRKLHG